MMAETKEERRKRIQEDVAKRSQQRRETYFEEQAKSKAAAEALAPALPEADAFRYDYAWRQDVGSPQGELRLVKSPNPYYDASTNEIIDPATGERRPAGQSMWSGPTSFRGDGTVVTGTSDSLYDAKRATGYGMDTQGNLYRGSGTSGDPFTKNGTPFTGTWQGKSYSNGILRTSAGAGNNDGAGDNNAGDGSSGDGKGDSLVQYYANLAAEEKRTKSLAAFEVFRGFLRQFGLEGLAADVEKYKMDGLSDDELLIRLRTESDAYKRRFAANEKRIAKGLRALSEAQYINLEDEYQDVMRRYGLPASYYTKGEMGVQAGFEQLIANDVSQIELEDRIQTAQRRVINAAPQVTDSLRQFYPEIGQGDILAYFLDPDKAIENIKRKVTAAEIGGAATMAGLTAGRTRAEELGAYGVTGEVARQGFANIAEFLPTAQKLGDIYSRQGMGPFTQTTAEQEVFGLAGAPQAATKRKRLSQLEQAAFSGQAGIAQGALARDRAGAI